MVKLRVNGTRAGPETAVRLKEKMSCLKLLSELGLGLRAGGLGKSLVFTTGIRAHSVSSQNGKLYFERH